MIHRLLSGVSIGIIVVLAAACGAGDEPESTSTVPEMESGSTPGVATTVGSWAIAAPFNEIPNEPLSGHIFGYIASAYPAITELRGALEGKFIGAAYIDRNLVTWGRAQLDSRKVEKRAVVFDHTRLPQLV